jgi:hypothetical protein
LDQQHWFLQFFVSKLTKNLTQSLACSFEITYGTGTNFENSSSNRFKDPKVATLTLKMLTEAADMNGRFQMQGGKNWILPK